MGNRYVNVVITRETQATSQQGFGLSLIHSTEKNMAYKEYTEVADVSTDYGAESETYKLAAKIFGQSPRPEKVAIHGVLYEPIGDTPAEIVAALNMLMLEQNDFFYVHCTLQTDEVITALAAWIDTQKKLYFASTANKTLHTLLKSVNTVLLVHPKPETYPAAAWVGRCSPLEIGSYTWTFKNLNGIEPSGYNPTELKEIEVGASSYIREGGVDITSKGITTKGEYIDIIQGQYYLESRLAEAVYGLFVRLPKVSFVTVGISLIAAEMETVLKRAANQGIIAQDGDGNPLYSLDIPDISEISANDKAARKLPNMNWTATIAGAVENVDIGGTLKL